MAYTFGQYIRAARLGYRWNELRRCWIRISIRKDGLYRVDVVPENKLLNGHDKVDEFVCWWEGENPEELLLECKPLVGLRRPTRRLMFIVDDAGNQIGSARSLS